MQYTQSLVKVLMDITYYLNSEEIVMQDKIDKLYEVIKNMKDYNA